MMGILNLVFFATAVFSRTLLQSDLISEEFTHLKEFDEDDKVLLDLHKSLILADSTTQLYEKAAAKVLVDYFDTIGWSSQLLPTYGNLERPNVLAWPGRSNRTKLLVSSHIDTVPPYIPYSITSGRIWGRGSADAKAAVATQIEAVRRLISAKKISSDDVALLYVVGEESAGDGMKSFSRMMEEEAQSWERVLFGEPTENQVAIGHKGMVMFNISVSGKAAHSGYPELGSSANDKLIDLLFDLKRHSWPYDPILGNTTFNIGRIEGGAAANVVSAFASAHCSLRVSAGLPVILEYLRTTIASHADSSFDIEQAAEPTELDSLPGMEYDEVIVK